MKTAKHHWFWQETWLPWQPTDYIKSLVNPSLLQAVPSFVHLQAITSAPRCLYTNRLISLDNVYKATFYCLGNDRSFLTVSHVVSVLNVCTKNHKQSNVQWGVFLMPFFKVFSEITLQNSRSMQDLDKEFFFSYHRLLFQFFPDRPCRNNVYYIQEQHHYMTQLKINYILSLISLLASCWINDVTVW